MFNYPINRRKIRERALDIFKNNFFYIVGCFVLMYLIQIAVTVVSSFFAEVFMPISFLLYFIDIYLMCVMWLGLYKIIYNLDKGLEFNIVDLFGYFTKTKETLIPFATQIVSGLIVGVITVIVTIVILFGDIYDIAYYSPYISEYEIASFVMSIMPKIAVIAVLISVVQILISVVLLSVYGIIVKEDARLKNNILGNAFSIGLKNLKDYILMSIFFFVLSLIFVIAFIIGFWVLMTFPSEFMALVMFIVFIAIFIIYSIWVSITMALLIKEFINKEIAIRDSQYGNINGYYNYQNNYSTYQNNTNDNNYFKQTDTNYSSEDIVNSDNNLAYDDSKKKSDDSYYEEIKNSESTYEYNNGYFEINEDSQKGEIDIEELKKTKTGK